MMNVDRKKKRKMLKISANPADDQSQDVWLMKGTPVISVMNSRKLGIVNSSTFTVKSINPLVLTDSMDNSDIEITKEQFQLAFYVNYCSTVHKAQGETFDEPYTIHEWSKMSDRMRYTAISRARSKDLINVVDDYVDTQEQRKTAVKKRSELQARRDSSLSIINNILRGKASDECSVKHTGMDNQKLRDYLGIGPEGIPKGYEIDHIKMRKDHTTEHEFVKINWYSNLRLMTRSDNNARNREA
jgi:hypothetical protein